MAFKEFQLSADLAVKIYKRKSSRSLRLSVTPHGYVRVSIPAWAPYQSGLDFAASRFDWIKSQLPLAPVLLQDGQPIGKSHRLHFTARTDVTQAKSRLTGTEIVVSHPASMSYADAVVQQVASKAAIRALRIQAERLLPQRLEQLAGQLEFEYKSVSIKQLKSRWGSCDQQTNIVLNLFLMQLPWDLIDYVLIHELVHTEVLQHGAPFWAEMERVLPGAKVARKRIRDYQPILRATTPLAVA